MIIMHFIHERIKHMKKTFIITTLSIFMTIFVLFSVVNAEAQRIWGECIASNQNGFVLTTEGGDITATDGTGKGYGLLGIKGWYTIENGVITAFEEIPEYGLEIGYLSDVSTGIMGDSVLVDIYTNEKLSLALANRIEINGISYRLRDSAQEVAELLKSNTGFISYQTETFFDEETSEVISVEINKIAFVESKSREYDKQKSDFSDLTYKITDNTQFYFSADDGAYYQIAELPTEENYYYSFDVISYDKDYNARTVVVNEMYERDVNFYAHTMGYYMYPSGYALKTVDKNGMQADLFLEEEYSYSGIMDNLNSFDGIIEYKKDQAGFVMEIIPLTVAATFENAAVVDGKLGDYTITDIIAFEAIAEGRQWNYKKADLSDKYLYSGYVYKTSENKTALWIYSKAVAGGTPIVDFSARDRGDSLRVSADIDLNGYTGGGFVYVAIYKANRLVEVFNFDLTDNDGIIGDDAEINGKIYYGENETGSDFTVKGFVWNEIFSPLADVDDIVIK